MTKSGMTFFILSCHPDAETNNVTLNLFQGLSFKGNTFPSMLLLKNKSRDCHVGCFRILLAMANGCATAGFVRSRSTPATAYSFPCLWQVLRFLQPWPSQGKIDFYFCHPALFFLARITPSFISGSFIFRKQK